MTPTCKALMIEGEILIPEAEVGVSVTAKCESGLFEGEESSTHLSYNHLNFSCDQVAGTVLMMQFGNKLSALSQQNLNLPTPP